MARVFSYALIAGIEDVDSAIVRLPAARTGQNDATRLEELVILVPCNTQKMSVEQFSIQRRKKIQKIS